MKYHAFFSAACSLFIVLSLIACTQKQAKRSGPPVELNTLLTSIPRDTFVTVSDTLPWSSAGSEPASPVIHLKLFHANNDFLLCFRNVSYINLEKCLPGMHIRNLHQTMITRTGRDTLVVVNTRTMSYIRFIADSTFAQLNIDWTGDTANLTYIEPFCGTGDEVFDHSL